MGQQLWQHSAYRLHEEDLDQCVGFHEAAALLSVR